jgi:Fe-S oxidoreductase
MLVHTFWILGYPGETYDEMKQTVDFALSSGADSFSFAILSPLPGTPIYREVMKKNLWWEGKTLDDILYRSSLIKVDGFTGSEEFEKFVNETNIKANLVLKQKNPKRFELKYGKNEDKSSLVKQT